MGVTEGLRAATAVAAMVAVALFLNNPLFSWAAFAAFWTCLSDPGGPYRLRLYAMGGFALAGTLLAGGFSAVAAFGPCVAAPILFVTLFLCGLSRVWGEEAAQSGVLASVVAVVAVASPKTPEAALEISGVFLAGSLWALGLCLLVWRKHPHAPARSAVGAIFHDLRAMTVDFLELSHSKWAAKIDWQSYSNDHRLAVRGTIERARSVIGQSTGESRDNPIRHVLNAMIDAGDHIFAGLIALSSDPEGLKATSDTQFLLLLKMILIEIERQVRQVEPNPDQIMIHAELLSQFSKTIDGLARRVGEESARALRELAHAFGTSPEQRSAAEAGGAAKRDVVQRWGEMRLSRPTLLHAVRMAIAVLISYAITTYYDLPYAYWATMATVVVMRPQATFTWLRTVERVIGSVAGGVAAAFLMVTFHSPLELLALIFPLAAATIAFRSVNYSVFVFFLTPLFVLVTDMLGIGHGGDIAADRILNNVLGSLVGVVCCLLLWPDPEPKGFRKQLAEAIESNMHYASLSLQAKALQLDVIAAARRSAGIASSAAEMTWRRMIMEGQRRRAHLKEAEDLLSDVRQLAGAATALWINGERVCSTVNYDALGSRLSVFVRDGKAEAADEVMLQKCSSKDEMYLAAADVVASARRYVHAFLPLAAKD
jgi:uncharacterized membrane protein YccC